MVSFSLGCVCQWCGDFVHNCGVCGKKKWWGFLPEISVSLLSFLFFLAKTILEIFHFHYFVLFSNSFALTFLLSLPHLFDFVPFLLPSLHCPNYSRSGQISLSEFRSLFHTMYFLAWTFWFPLGSPLVVYAHLDTVSVMKKYFEICEGLFHSEFAFHSLALSHARSFTSLCFSFSFKCTFLYFCNRFKLSYLFSFSFLLSLSSIVLSTHPHTHSLTLLQPSGAVCSGWDGQPWKRWRERGENHDRGVFEGYCKNVCWDARSYTVFRSPLPLMHTLIWSLAHVTYHSFIANRTHNIHSDYIHTHTQS